MGNQSTAHKELLMQPDKNKEEEKEKSAISARQGYKKKTLRIAVRTHKQKLLEHCHPTSPNELDP
eukprot:15050889-Ditylum_brightwellii.AAC.1